MPSTCWRPALLQGLEKLGGDEGDRTLDLRIANATLSQLSYVPTARHYTAETRLGRHRRPPAPRDASGNCPFNVRYPLRARLTAELHSARTYFPSHTMTREAIQSPDAPAAIGPYSQAIRAGDTVYLSGQIGLDPRTGQLVDGIEAQAHQVFGNLSAVAKAAGGALDDMVKVSVLLADLADFAKVNDIMATYFRTPYPARATYQVAGLPRGARIEVEGVLVLSNRTDAPSSQTGWRETFDQNKGQ